MLGLGSEKSGLALDLPGMLCKVLGRLSPEDSVYKMRPLNSEWFADGTISQIPHGGNLSQRPRA